MFENMDNWEFSSKILRMKEKLEQEQEDVLGSFDTDNGKCYFQNTEKCDI
jgi:hypothetical protein